MAGTVRCGDRFGRLPVELRIDVLTYLAPSHLRACIRASPAMLAAFTVARTSLLFRAARNGIHPQAINEALLTLYSPRFKKSGDKSYMIFGTHRSHLPPPVFLNVMTTQFLNGRRAQGPRFPQEMETLVSLLRLIILVEDCICGFVRFTELSRTPDWVPTLQHWQHDSAHQLSETEHLRLQRAFFRFELWCRMRSFAGPGLILRRMLGSVDHEIFRSIPVWEREELFCVAHYVQRQYEVAVGDICQAFAKAYERAVKSENHRNPRLRDVKMRDNTLPYFSRSDSRARDTYIRRVQGFGLGFLRNFARGDFAFRRSVMQLTFHFFDPRVDPVDRGVLGNPGISVLWAEHEHRDLVGNSGALWRRVMEDWDSSETPYLRSLRATFIRHNSTCLRDIGWAIWDEDRLKRLTLWKNWDLKRQVDVYGKQPPCYRLLRGGLGMQLGSVSTDSWEKYLKEFAVMLWDSSKEEVWRARIAALVETTGFNLGSTCSVPDADLGVGVNPAGYSPFSIAT